MARKGMLSLATAALAAAALAPAATAAPAVDGVFDLPGKPQHLTLAAGDVWIALDSPAADFAKVTPDGTVTGYDSPEVSSPKGIRYTPDGRLWVTQSGGVAYFTPDDPTAARAVAVSGLNDPRAITFGPDGNLWTASGDRAFRISLDGRYVAFRVDGMGARGIAAGHGKLYIADFGSQRIVALTTDGRVAEAYRANGGPQEVAVGPGGQVAFTDPTFLPHQIGRFMAPGGPVLTTDVPGADPFGITFAVDDRYWVANFATSTVTRMTPGGETETVTGLPPNSGPRYLAQGAGSTVWVGLETAEKVARIGGVAAGPTPPGDSSGDGDRGGPASDTTPPTLSQLRAPRTLRVGRAGKLRVTLSEAATLTLRFERKLPGRRKAGRCVAPRRAPSAKRCTRLVRVAVQRRAVRQGANTVRFGGRVGKRVLPAGRYRLTIVARDAAGNASRPLRRALRIAARPR